MRTLLALVLVAACSSSSPPPPQPAPTGGPSPARESPSPITPPANTTAPGIGQTCGSDGSCASGLECISYYGIAGARGPQFKSCEVRCGDDKKCPTGLACKTIADGPGQVCR